MSNLPTKLSLEGHSFLGRDEKYRKRSGEYADARGGACWKILEKSENEIQNVQKNEILAGQVGEVPNQLPRGFFV